MLKGCRNVLNPKTRLKEVHVAALEPSALASLSAFFVRLFEDFRRGLSYRVDFGGGYLGTIKGVWEILTIIITQKYT